MVPTEEAVVLGWSAGLATTYETGGQLSPQQLMQPFQASDGIYGEPDIVYWARTNSLGVQYHPEYMDVESDGWKYFQDLLTKYIFDK
jgi:hypothetical protein